MESLKINAIADVTYKGENEMIDFKNGSFVKLKKTKGDVNKRLITPLLVS